MKYTIYPNAEHDSWTETYGNEELYRWFLSHVRFKYAYVPMPVEPERFVGKYTSKENSAEVYLKEGGLHIALETSGNKELPLNPCGIDSFTFGDFGTYEIKFMSNGRGNYDVAIVYERQMTLLKKTHSKTV